MKKKSLSYIICFLVMLFLLVLFMDLNICAGSVKISFSDIIAALSGDRSNTSVYNIICVIRFPRAAAAAVLGGALSVSGFLLQTYFSNPLAGPFVLGISSGAKLFVAVTMIACLEHGIVMNSGSLILASFAGSMISMGFILLVSGKIKKSSALIVSGVMTGYICSAVTDFAVTFADDSNIVNLHNWSMGSFSGISRRDAGFAFVIVFICVITAFLMSKQINVYLLGESYAGNSGVNIPVFRVMLVLVSGLLSACVTALAGPVSFIGIAVPHIVRGVFKTAKANIIIPASFLGGAVFCLACDLTARLLFAPAELSISSVTSVFGAPVVIWIMLRKSRRS